MKGISELLHGQGQTSQRHACAVLADGMVTQNRFAFFFSDLRKLYIFVLHVLGSVAKYFVLICIVSSYEFGNYTQTYSLRVRSVIDI